MRAQHQLRTVDTATALTPTDSSAPVAPLDIELADKDRNLSFFPEIKSVMRRNTAVGGDLPLKRSAVMSALAAANVAPTGARGRGHGSPESYQALYTRGMMLAGQGELSSAEPVLLSALDGMRAALGDLHVHTLHSMGAVGLLLQARGNLTGAEKLLTEAVTGKRKRLHDGHPDTLQAVSNLAALLYSRGDVAAAEPLFREVQYCGLHY